MYVKSLRIAGFKSFGDPVTFELDPTLNGIIGPNGSGKSNIADAVTWVLGSQAPSSLRSGTMEDVIFAGSQGRARLAVAEVELTLDNATGTLPLDVSEATISRSSDRTGASEYRINGVPCRLLDIAELLSDTGIGRSLHTVVGQGQLDAILQARPEDRRGFIEEAAQIGKYRRRKERAVRKIERVEDNLVRLGDVVSELRRALRPLKRQAAAAAHYSELLAEHRTLRQGLSATEMAALGRVHEAHDPAAEVRRAVLLEDELEHVRAALKVAAAEREALVAAAEGQVATAHGIRRAADGLAGLALLASERAGRLNALLEAETEGTYRERIRLLDRERVRWEAQTGKLGGAARASRARAAEAEAKASGSALTAGEAEEALAAARATETAAVEALVRAEGGEAAGRATLGSIQARAEAALERKQLAERALAGAAGAIEAAEREVRALERDLDTGVEAAAGSEAAHEGERERLDGLRQRLGASATDRAASAARLATLEEVKELLRDVSGVASRLDVLLDDARAAAALAVADESAAARIVAEAEAAVELRWAEVAAADQRLAHLDALMSGSAERLAGVRRAQGAREVELATLNEELARSREAQAAAERSAAEERAGLPARRATATAAGAVREEAEAALEAARSRASDTRSAATDAELEARSTEERALAAQLRAEEAVSAIADATAALAGLEDLRRVLHGARGGAESISRSAGNAAEVAREWARRAEGAAAAARDAVEAHQTRMESLRARESDLASRLEEAARARSASEVRRAEARARMDAVAERAMEEWGMSPSDLAALQPLDADAVHAARRRADELERSMRSIGGVNPRAGEEYEELAERERFLEDQIADLKASRRDLLRIVGEVDATIVAEFQGAFAAVAQEFEVVFARLFPGGSGRMRLLDPDDPLTSGVDIEARPAGKRVSKLSLLSGGERSLVALALLFAIFRARPSPFYLLDEVEAALDDVNLQRFIDLVAELSASAQVIIVTHQRRTMEAADVLYGVSMGEDGVSRVIAKRMDSQPV